MAAFGVVALITCRLRATVAWGATKLHCSMEGAHAAFLKGHSVGGTSRLVLIAVMRVLYVLQLVGKLDAASRIHAIDKLLPVVCLAFSFSEVIGMHVEIM